MKLSKLKKAVIALFIVLCSFIVLFLWASTYLQSPGNFTGQISEFDTGQSSKLQSNNEIRVLTWNIAYAYGFGSAGNGYVPRSSSEMANRLKNIGEIIRDSGADVVLLQEIDFDSERSHNVDQLKKLSHITGLRYGARCVAWEAGYVPFPYWPPGHHFGSICSGGAVLSRYPVIVNRITLYPKPKKNPWWYNAFYLFRYSQQVQIKWDERVVWVINNHLEAFDKVNRQKQADALVKMVKKNISANKQMVIVGGDMNTIPSEATLQYGYPDDKDADYRNDNTMPILRNLPLKEVVSEESYKRNESAFFTFPAHAPNRRLDYLFVPEDVSVKNVKVVRTGDLSDHLPVYAELIFPPK